MIKRNAMTWMGSALLLVGGFVAFSPAAIARAGDAPDSEQVSRLLAEAKSMAFQLKDDAATMETFSRMDLGWESHKIAINQIKDDVNALGKQVAKLQAAEANAAPWQRVAIERMNPYLDEMCGYTTAVIEHLNGDARHTVAEYRDFLQANADYSADLASMIANFVDYGNAKQRREELGEKLEIAPCREMT